MNNNATGIRLLRTITMMALVRLFAFSQTPKDVVNGNLLQFNDNGFWCWFQDERAVVDIAKGKLIAHRQLMEECVTEPTMLLFLTFRLGRQRDMY